MKWYERFPEAVLETRREQRKAMIRQALRRYQRHIEQVETRMRLTTLRVAQ